MLNTLAAAAVAAILGTPVLSYRDYLATLGLAAVMHLWFLVNLALYTLALWPALGAVHRLRARPLPAWGLVAGLAGATTLVAIATKPYSAAIVGEGYQLWWYAADAVIGAQLHVLDWAAKRLAWLVALGALCYVSELAALAAAGAQSPETAAALANGGWARDGAVPYTPRTVLAMLAEGLAAWAWSLAALGAAARWLIRPHRWLPTLTAATFPLYVLHFPLVLIGLAVAKRMPWPWGLECALVTLASYAATAALVWLSQRLGPTAILVGGRDAQRLGCPDTGPEP